MKIKTEIKPYILTILQKMASDFKKFNVKIVYDKTHIYKRGSSITNLAPFNIEFNDMQLTTPTEKINVKHEMKFRKFIKQYQKMCEHKIEFIVAGQCEFLFMHIDGACFKFIQNKNTGDWDFSRCGGWHPDEYTPLQIMMVSNPNNPIRVDGVEYVKQ